jgi:DNA-binding MarR family transcriptional regulator
MLMVLQETPKLCRKELLREVNMPEVEVDNAAEILQRKGLVSFSDECYNITTSGEEQAEALWALSKQEQDKMFGEFSEDEIATFKKILTSLACR